MEIETDNVPPSLESQGPVKSGPLLSIRFLVIALLLLGVGYVGCRWAMTRVFVYQEKARVDQAIRSAMEVEYDDSLAAGGGEPGMLSEEDSE